MTIVKSLTVAISAALCIFFSQGAFAQSYNYSHPYYVNAYQANYVHGYQANALPVTYYRNINSTSDVQSRLMNLGYYVGPAGANGVKNEYTKAAIRMFQENHSLKVDGIVGPKTYAKLNSYYKNYSQPQYYSGYHRAYNPNTNTYNYRYHPVTSRYRAVR